MGLTGTRFDVESELRGEEGGMGHRRPPEAYDPHFTTRLARAMTEAGMKPGELARRFPTHKATVSRWRSGLAPDDPVRRARLAELLGVNEGYLFAGENPRPAAEAPGAAAMAFERIEPTRLQDLTPTAVLQLGTLALLEAISRPGSMSASTAALWIGSLFEAGRRDARTHQR